MKDPNEFRSEVRSYADKQLEEARKWRQLAEAAFQRARLCEDAGREASDLKKLNADLLPDLEAELEKINQRLKARLQHLSPVDISVAIDRTTIEELATWFNKHTNYTGPGPTSPPEPFDGAQPWPR